MKKGNIGGINEMKYPMKNSHASADDSIQVGRKEITKRGIARTINTIGVINKSLCSLNCSQNIIR